MMRSASPSLWVRSTTASSRYRGIAPFCGESIGDVAGHAALRRNNGVVRSGHPSSSVAGALALVAVLATSLAALAFTPDRSGGVAAWWPAAGIAAATLCLAPRRHLVPLALGLVAVTGAANLLGGRDPAVALAFGLANTAEAAVVALVVRSGVPGRPGLRSQADVARYVVGCAVGAVVIALGVATTLAAFDLGPVLTTAVDVAASHAAATLCIVPSALAWSGWASWRGRDTALQVLALAVLVSGSLYLGLPILSAFLVVPLLVWAAYRGEPAVLSAELTVLTGAATVATAAGIGPFPLIASVVPGINSVALVQLFLVSAVLMTVPLAVALAEQRRLASRVARSEALFRSTFSDSHVGKALVDRAGDDLVVRAVNPAGVTLLGATHANEVVGRSLAQLVEFDVAPHERDATLDAGRAWRSHAGVPGHPEAWLRTTLSPLPSAPDDGDGIHAITVEFVDVGGEQRVRRDLDAERQASRTLVDAVPCLVLVTDLDGTVLRVNRAVLDLGWEREHLLGEPVWAHLVPPADRLSTAALWHRLDERPELVPVEGLVQTPGGATTPVLWQASYVEDTDGSAVAIVLSGVDVSAQQEAHLRTEAALSTERQAVERLRQLDQAKHDFISTASHELRTPVTTIVGYADMLADGTLGSPDPAHARILDAIRRNGERLKELTNHLLVLSQLDSADLAAVADEVDLGSIAREAVDALELKAADRGVHLQASCPSGVRLSGDGVLLDRLVTNLVSNAVKFSRSGDGVDVRVRTDGVDAVLVVHDEGMGIPVAEHDQVFTRFYRSSTAQQQAIQGTGLGLSIVAAIAERHGGRVTFTSRPDAGSTFEVRLPLRSGA
ncbi:ATP-binding protein [Nocardioides zeae]|uniref:Sensor-like histidine kinase SenX3 n=1 Tax=Nocardioides imazamoxiresistens TaxID=3231893 RepID=A0ABU3Q146_9ACTN|nr:ATP-binding protein [Nocardioides zeae]MDT9595237.1 ATP-binding protein [Nocardioides zeae]